jgi:Ca2+/Na+ antiporter
MIRKIFTGLMMRKNYMITRKDGVILLVCYIGYVAYLILKA